MSSSDTFIPVQMCGISTDEAVELEGGELEDLPHDGVAVDAAVDVEAAAAAVHQAAGRAVEQAELCAHVAELFGPAERPQEGARAEGGVDRLQRQLAVLGRSLVAGLRVPADAPEFPGPVSRAVCGRS